MQTRLAYIQEGEGIPVVLLHGFCERKEIWDRFIPILAKESKVIALDLPGFGENEAIDADISINYVAEHVEAFLKSIEVRQAIIVGHSLGGYVALSLANQFPQLISGLCLFHSTAKADSDEKKATRDKTALFLKENGMEAFARNFADALFSPHNHQKLVIQIAEYKQMLSQTPVETAVAYTKAMRDRPERMNVLKEAEYPCLFIAGKDDQAVPYADLLEQSKLPKADSKLITLEHCAHMGMYEQEERSKHALLNFIKQIKSKL
ncbi:alpha/beta fold hydrolase [Catalinimonas niigatensis]|uniref:alpha/beta fold hydrolase n=1 Tax=Catalinimonas niigatensis TaxID=1397264 RepID=UPI0026668E80|nr:alpha/beta hydrolase [Catalinimonas niigatensis]WPP50793.1 alpha/beta hydrolase [Catalinimonas niigatensis]